MKQILKTVKTIVKRIGSVLLFLLVWASVVGLPIIVWDTRLIESTVMFYCALGALLFFSAVFSSAETAFTVLQENTENVSKINQKKAPGDARKATKFESWYSKEKDNPRPLFKTRFRLAAANIKDEGFEPLLAFLLVMNNIVNLGGMYLVGKSLTPGVRSDNFSLVISAVIVVLVGEVAAKFVGYNFSAATASWTVLVITVPKKLLGWYTSRLVLPIQKAVIHLAKSRGES